MRKMFEDKRRMASLRKVALACAALVLAITSLSAYLRLSGSGLGCEPWPQCYGQSLVDRQQGVAAPAGTLVVAARIAHRITAVVALLLIIAMVMNTWSKAPVLRREGRMVLGLLFLALFLAILGRWTSGSTLPAVVLGNLLGGFAMFALSCRLVQSVHARPASAAPSAAMARWAWAAVALLVLQVALGGLVNAGHAGLSCPDLLRCDVSAGSWQALDPWHQPGLDTSDPANPPGALVHVLHRLGALVVVAALLPLGVAAWRRGQGAGLAVIALLALEAILGVVLVKGGLPLPVALAHNILAALLLAATLGLAAGGSPARQSAAG